MRLGIPLSLLLAACGGADPGGGDAAVASACEDTSQLLQAAEERQVSQIAVDEEHVYYAQAGSEQDGLFRLPKQGGAAEFVAESVDPLGINAILLDGDSVYIGDSKLRRVPKAGGAVEELADLGGSIMWLASDADAVYALRLRPCCGDEGEDAIVRVDKAGGVPRTLATARRLFALTLADGAVYWTGSLRESASDTVPGALARTDLASGDTRVLFELAADGRGPNPLSFFGPGFVVHDTEVYFNSINVDDLGSSGVYRLAREGGEPELFARTAVLQFGFVRGDALVLVDTTQVARISLADGSTQRVACPGAGASIFSATADATHVFYTAGDAFSRALHRLPLAP